jgi:hypothetical protein
MTYNTSHFDYDSSTPSLYPTHSSIGLALAGYELSSTSIINFELTLAAVTSSTLTVRVSVHDNL